MKRVLTAVLALCMVLAIGSTTVLAAASPSVQGEVEVQSTRALPRISLKPTMVLTFRTGTLDVMTVPFVKGEPAKTITVPTTFCLATNTEDVSVWVPVDQVNFTQEELTAGEEITLDYDMIRDMFGVRWSSTVIKMIGK